MPLSVLTASTERNAADRPRRCRHLATLATQALLAEAELTPKPGLVDRRGPGAHADMSLELIRQSAAVLEPYFFEMGFISMGREINKGLREELATIGRDAERAMFKATRGSNTHKGAIWNLGLLMAAAARNDGQSAREIATAAGAIARLPDRAQPGVVTHGDIARNLYGAVGARGEAAKGFPHVVNVGLPTLRRQRVQGLSEELSRLDALLSIMSELDDTCVLYRGGAEALGAVRRGAQAVLRAGGTSRTRGRDLLGELDDELIERNLSPGGSADLLAATIFLDAAESQQSEVRRDQSDLEVRDGAA